MRRAIQGTIVAVFAGWLAFAQSETAPKFEAADVHVSPKATGPMSGFGRFSPVRGGRYEVKTASIVDMIRVAYGYDNDKILGGPNWLEMDRFDISAKVPAESNAEMHKQMLQSLLADRFHLVVRKESKPMPTFVLTAGKKPKLEEAAGSEQTGCRPKASGSGPSGPGVTRLTMMGNDGGPPTMLTLGPGMTVEYNCRNISMEAFAANLRSMIGANLGSTPIKDETGLKGNWNFDFTYSMSMFGPMMDNSTHITVQAAVEKQLGLKMEERQDPTPVIVVVSVNRTPGENPPGTAEALPPIAYPTEFEVASIKPSDPGGRGGRMNMLPGGRFVSEGMNLHFLLQRAFNTFNNEEIQGIPAFADSDRYDITAKAPAVAGVPMTNMDMDAMAPLLLSLFKDRFELKYHREERPVTAYTLVAAKPKMKKADPEERTSCKSNTTPPPAPPGSRTMTCTNITMDQFVERLQGNGPDLTWPVANATGLEGGWDLKLTYSQRAMMAMQMAGRGGGGVGVATSTFGAGPGGDAPAMPTASDPSTGYTIFEAIEKQLGLKLEKQKRPMPVIVIDHLSQKPTEN